MTELLSRSDRIRQIEAVTRIRVPYFVKDHPPINPAEAAKMVLDLHIDDVFLLGFQDPQRRQFLAELEGLKFCRRNGVRPNEAYKLSEEKLIPKSASDIFDHFLNGSTLNLEEVKRREKERIDKRNKAILQLETDLLRRRGIKMPSFRSLLEYCAWVPEVTGYNERIRGWAKDKPSWLKDLPEPVDVYWDLLQHYYQIVEGADKSFDPLKDWEDHFTGGKRLDSIDSYGLQNIGKEDISYYAMVMRWGSGIRTRPGRYDFEDVLITHTTPLETAQKIFREGYINSDRVPFSSGRVVSLRSRRLITFVFPRSLVDQVYCLKPYTEPGGGSERELRAHEKISIEFCVGAIPTVSEIFQGDHGDGIGTHSIGDETVKRWGEQYLKIGKILLPEEEVRVREIARGLV